MKIIIIDNEKIDKAMSKWVNKAKKNPCLKYVAVEENGFVYAFTHEPFVCDFGWDYHEGECLGVGEENRKYLLKYWEETLREIK